MEGQTNSPPGGSASIPTHQKNSTWDAFMWSSKLQLPSLAEPTSPGLAAMPTHRRGASMPPNLDENESGLPPIRYDDLVVARPRLGHRTRPGFSSIGADGDWPTGLTSGMNGNDDSATQGSSLDDGSGRDEMLVAEPPPTHRRGGSIPMTTLGGLDLYGTDGLFGSSPMTANNSNNTPGGRPQHRRSVTFQGTTSSHNKSDMFDFDSLKQTLEVKSATTTPTRMTTPPPPQQQQPQPSLVLPPQQQQQQQPMHQQPAPQSMMMPMYYGTPTSNAPPNHDVMYADYHQPAAARGLDPNMQMQLQMQQALIVQQQQWLLAMQMQQQQQHQRGQPSAVRPPPNYVFPGTPSPPMMMPQQQPGNQSPMTTPSTRYNRSNQPQQQQQQQQPQHSPSVASSATTDVVLAEYKSTGMRPRIEELRGHVLAFATDAHGSRFLQYQMEIAKPEDKDMLVGEALPYAVQLMQDTFGNYVIQNFLEHATSSSRRLLADSVKGFMLQLSIQPHGCRVVQRALDLVDIDQRNDLLRELLVPKGNVFQAARNTHATHVLQKTVSILRRDSQLELGGNDRVKGSVELMRAMEKAIADDVIPLLLHPHAYRLVLNVLSDCDVTKSVHIARAVDTIKENRDQLCVDQHGNFMLQHMLDNKQADSVLDFVQERFVELSQHKFGSHLVEKCFAVASDDRCAQMVEQFLRPTSERNIAATKRLKAQQGEGQEWGDVTSPALALMKDPYANFVVQKAFDRVQPGPLKTELINLVQDHAELLQKFTYGRHILAHVTSSRGGGSPQRTSNSPVFGSHNNNNGSSSPSPGRNSPSYGPQRHGKRGGRGGGGGN